MYFGIKNDILYKVRDDGSVRPTQMDDPAYLEYTANGGVLQEVPEEVLPTLSEAELQKQKILAELAELDLVLPRIAEDIINATNTYASLPDIVKERYDRKASLRSQFTLYGG